MSKRLLLPALLTGAALAATGWYFHGQPGALAGWFPSAATAKAGVSTPPSIAAFLTAATPEDRAALVIGGSSYLSQLEARYQHGDPDNLKPVDFRPAPDGPAAGVFGNVATLTASPGRGLPEVTAAFRKNESGSWLLDWPLYHQTLTDAVATFAAHPAPGETTLRVRLTRPAIAVNALTGNAPAGSEGSTGQTEAAPIALVELTEPFTPRTRLPLAADRADLASLIARDLPPGTSRPATVVVAWVHPPDGGPLQAVWRRHVCWDFEGLNALPLPATPTPDPAALAAPAAALATHVPPSGLSLKMESESESEPPSNSSKPIHPITRQP